MRRELCERVWRVLDLQSVNVIEGFRSISSGDKPSDDLAATPSANDVLVFNHWPRLRHYPSTGSSVVGSLPVAVCIEFHGDDVIGTNDTARRLRCFMGFDPGLAKHELAHEMDFDPFLHLLLLSFANAGSSRDFRDCLCGPSRNGTFVWQRASPGYADARSRDPSSVRRRFFSQLRTSVLCASRDGGDCDYDFRGSGNHA